MHPLKTIPRDYYLQKLIRAKHNGLIKIVSGVRRCGKSYLLFRLFVQHLREQGVPDDHIITAQLDRRDGKELRDPDAFIAYVRHKVEDQDPYYILIDEVQMMPNFEEVLNELLDEDNLDVYVTGSNARFLTKDVITEFRGRSEDIRLYPLSFSEYFAQQNEGWEKAYRNYAYFGGMPLVVAQETEGEKSGYLVRLFQETYLRDVIERHKIRNSAELEELLSIIASNVGSLTNPARLERVFQSRKNVKLSAQTIEHYIDCLENAFLVRKVLRYDIKGNSYVNTPMKYYFVDPGLRNACLHFRQFEYPHLTENIVYTELVRRGYLVDVGKVQVNEKQSSKTYQRRDVEIDFVANLGSKRYYLQVTTDLPNAEKIYQEKRPFYAVYDNFKKILVLQNGAINHQDQDGITIVSLEDFLLHPATWE